MDAITALRNIAAQQVIRVDAPGDGGRNAFIKERMAHYEKFGVLTDAEVRIRAIDDMRAQF